MKVSTKGRYALRLMLDIAQNSVQDAVTVKDISTRQNISEKYLERIVRSNELTTPSSLTSPYKIVL